jgi:MFS family permease
MVALDIEHKYLEGQRKGFAGLLHARPYLIFWSVFSCIGSFMYGTDQGVLSNLLTGQNFGAHFPHVYTDATLKGWVVAVLQLGAWLGALINGPLADRISRKYSLMVAAFVRGKKKLDLSITLLLRLPAMKVKAIEFLC